MINCTKCGQALNDDVRFCGNCGAPTSSSGNSEADARIAAFERVLGFKYKILERAGVGGFAEVYLGEHTQLGRKVAIKILHGSYASQPEMVERFRRESKSAAKLSHPNIIDIYDVGEGEGINYFVMKFVEGETLSKKMHREKQVAPGEAISIIRQVADALAYAHDHDVIHRDIKPANVMLDLFKKPVLMDFGIARVQLESNLTKTGTLMGTPHYLPPEQPLGKPVDGRSDIYSLGIVFYEMLAGRPPFHDENSVTLIFKHINDPPPPLKDFVPDIAPELSDVVHKMIEKLPESRYQSAAEVVEALDAVAGMYPAPTPASKAGRSTGGGNRNTEQLLQLARENLSLQKFDKAIEIFATVVKRDPQNEIAMSAINDMAYILAERFSVHIAKNEFPDAKQIVSQLARLPLPEEKIANYRLELESAEQGHAKESEFRKHYEAARVALDHDNASGAIERLTSALTVNPTNKEAQDLLKQARSKYETNREAAEFENAFSEAEFYFEKGTFEQALAAIKKALDIRSDQRALEMFEKINAALKEKAYKKSEQERLLDRVDELCEKLQFSEALAELESGRASFPAIVENRTAVVQRNQALYHKYAGGLEMQEKRKWSEAASFYSDFLLTAPPYDFQVFYTLRKKAEEAVKSVEREAKLQGKYQQRKTHVDVEQQLKKADVLVRMGQLEQAREECLRLLKETDNHPLVLAKLHEVEQQLPAHMRTPTNPEGIPIEHPPTVQFQKTSMGVPVVPPSPRLTGPHPKPAPPAGQPFDDSGTRVVARPQYQPSQARKTEETPFPPPAPPVREAPSGGKSPILFVLIGVGVLVLGGLLYLFLSPSKTDSPDPVQDPQQQQQQQQQVQDPKTTDPVVTPEVASLPVSIDSLPWATINISGGTLKETVHETTPTLVKLPPGRYTLVFESPGLTSFTETVDIHNGSTSFSFTFKDWDAEKVVDSVVK